MDINNSVRLADDQIYLNEDRFGHPKEMFKFIRSVITPAYLESAENVLDVGCATGEFIYFIKSMHEGLKCTGIDISKAMIELAKKKQPGQEFIQEDILTNRQERNSKYDVVVCTGVLQIFDEIEVAITNLVSSVRSPGVLIIAGSFNNHDIDVLMRYKQSTEELRGVWETGWNLYSTTTYENYLKQLTKVKDWHWHDFRLPFALEERSDSMRSWTIGTENNPYQLVNGACQLLYTKVLRIEI